ncbi:MAG: 4-hydroxythreonine-4-phosphate dehydrogenase PdxA [Nevskiales bacterium]
MPSQRPIIITAGEPAGIGPDLLIKLCQLPSRFTWVAVTDPTLLQQRANMLGYKVSVHKLQANSLDESLPPAASGNIYCLPVTLEQPVHAGTLDPGNASQVLATLDLAVQLCLQKRAHAMVTGPVHKAVINQAGIAFTGHTEYLARQCSDADQAFEPLMMLATPGLRVALATTHLALRDVAAQITAERIEKLLRILHLGLQQQFALGSPRILVAGLNPHAGEDGLLGREEIEVITPVLDKLRQQGMQLHGPLPADTLFTPKYLDNADAVFAMYHDQGLPVLKHKGFSNAVNITLGLPIIRTSVDHGTALDLAGTGQAEIGSLQYALKVAASMQTPKQQVAL